MNYGSIGSWWYFDIWAMALGLVMIGAGVLVVADVRVRTVGSVAFAAIIADRLYALAALYVPRPFVALQVLAALALGLWLLGDPTDGTETSRP